MCDESKTAKFMKTPWKYIDQTLPKKLPPVKTNIPVKDLPMIGYLEQTLSRKINESLCELGKFKPKYPFKSLQESACLFIGMYLKGISQIITSRT